MLTGMTEKRAGLQLSRALVAIVLLTVHTNMLMDKTDSTWSIECLVNINVHHAGLGFFPGSFIIDTLHYAVVLCFI